MYLQGVASQLETYLEHPRCSRAIRFRLSMNVHQRAMNEISRILITINNDPGIPDKTIDNFEGLSSGRPCLIQGESIQPLEGRLDVILSAKLLHKLLCVSLSQESYHSYQLE